MYKFVLSNSFVSVFAMPRSKTPRLQLLFSNIDYERSRAADRRSKIKAVIICHKRACIRAAWQLVNANNVVGRVVGNNISIAVLRSRDVCFTAGTPTV